MASAIPEITCIVPNTQEHSETTTISSLPTEIQLKIIKNLDRVSSVCLGITNKKFYDIHKELHPKVPLIAAHLYTKGGMRLFGLLKEWMKEAGLLWSASELKFVTPERREEIRSHSIRKINLVKGRELLRLEVLRDEKLLGGW
ncbi:hypothetical protein NA56DRAFT_715998 [Hyaloscypha hepaticicola]|uniref:F-box domain-containing protein n=1 Tax=Hyaloscypha hepaticicola TaxID=2082293 RepID=A0A2J6QBC6_9HELO|nr:hypothetical protein NA56DRAFT_715998 [Hyaloscypha hepaticicola]